MTSATRKIWISKLLKSLRISSYALLVILCLAILTFYIWLNTFELDTKRTEIEHYLSELFDRKLIIEGGLELHADFGVPSISAKSIKIANPTWSSDPWFAQAEELRASISLLDLLFSEVTIHNVKLSKAIIHIESNQKGRPNWPTGKPRRNTTENPNYIIPSIHNVLVEDIELVIKSKGRPILNLGIPTITASLLQGKAVTLEANLYYDKIPIQLALQGDTLANLFKDALHWPIQGKIELPAIDVNVDGLIKYQNELFELGLNLKNNEHRPTDKHIFGWRNDGLEHLAVEFNLKRQAAKIQVAINAAVKNLNLVHLNEQQNLEPDLNIQIGSLKINGSGNGEQINSIIQNSFTHYQAENCNLIINPGNKEKQKQFKIHTLDSKVSPNNKITSNLTGAYQSIQVKANAAHGRLIDLAWSHRPWPYKAKIQLANSQINVLGEIKKKTISGQLKLSGTSTEKTLTHFIPSPPDLGPFRLAGMYNYDGFRLAIEKINLQVADSILIGELKFIPSTLSKLSFSLNSQKLSLNKLLRNVKPLKNIHFKSKKLQLTGSGQGKSSDELMENLTLSLTSPGLIISPNNTDKISVKDIVIESKVSDSLSASASISTPDLAYEASVQSIPIQLMFKRDFIPIVTKLSNKNSSLTFRGKISGLIPDKKSPLEVAGSVLARIKDLSQMVEPDKLKLPGYKNISLKSRASYKNNLLTLNKLIVGSDDMAIEGDLIFNPKTPLFSLLLEDSQLDIGHIIDTYGPGEINLDETANIVQEPETHSGDPFIIPDKKINSSLLKTLNIDADIKSLKLRYKNEPINTLSTQFLIKNGHLEFNFVGQSHTGSDSTVNLSFDSNHEPPKAELKFDLNHLDYGEFFRTLELSNDVAGKVNFDINLKSQGHSIRELLKNANGNVGFISDAGRVPRRLLELWGAGFFRIFLPTTWIEEDTTDLHCAVGKFIVEDGYLKSQALLADTKRVTVAGDLAVNLENETINGIIKSKPKSVTLFRIGTPIAVSGTLKNPKTAAAENKLISIGKWVLGLQDPYALILLFGDLGSKEKNPCASLLEQTENTQTEN